MKRRIHAFTDPGVALMNSIDESQNAPTDETELNRVKGTGPFWVLVLICKQSLFS